MLSESKGKELDDALGPAPMTSGPIGDVEYLRAEAIELNSNTVLKEAILADLEPVSSTFLIHFFRIFSIFSFFFELYDMNFESLRATYVN